MAQKIKGRRYNAMVKVNPPFTRGGGENHPPPRFFSNLEKTGENFVKIFFLPEPNSFPDILKKKIMQIGQAVRPQ